MRKARIASLPETFRPVFAPEQSVRRSPSLTRGVDHRSRASPLTSSARRRKRSAVAE